MSPPAVSELPDEPVVAVGSVFGTVLWRLVRFTPGARGAILVDDHGDPIDFAHWPRRISALDVQIQGAQITRCMRRLEQAARDHGLTEPVVLLAAPQQCLLTAVVGDDCFASLSLRGAARFEFSLRQFTLATRDLTALLA